MTDQSTETKPARYRRTKGGVKVHKADCRYAVNGAPWNYADGYTADEIVSTLALHSWLSPCAVCKPEVS